MNDALNKSLIAGHEGLRLIAYKDSLGYLTVTVQVCAIAAVTPAAKTYNVAVF